MRLAVLLSGRGSNFEAIAAAIREGRLDAEIACVLSNRPDAKGIDRARELGFPVAVLDHRNYPTRQAHEQELLRELSGHRPEVVVLAGYMRRLTPLFLSAFPSRILNIHPSLLPSFPGVDAQRQALDYGVKISGCTVHLVSEVVDGGAILLQRAVPVLPGDTVETLSARILVQEHEAYVEALQALSAIP